MAFDLSDFNDIFNAFSFHQGDYFEPVSVTEDDEGEDEGDSPDFEAGKCDEEANSAITYGEWVKLTDHHHHDHHHHHHPH